MSEVRMTKAQANQELPREKLNRKGAEALTDIELLQAVIGSGGKGNDFKQIAKNLNGVINKVGADKLAIEDVKQIKGIGDAKATVVFAALEFWRRKFTKQMRPQIKSTDDAADQFASIQNKKQEYLAMITLDGAHRVINNHIISVGTLTTSIVHPREVFALAIEDRAASIIIAHNHPSGSLIIGEKDRAVTKRMRDAGELLGIPRDDHLVITSDDYVSAMD